MPTNVHSCSHNNTCQIFFNTNQFPVAACNQSMASYYFIQYQCVPGNFDYKNTKLQGYFIKVTILKTSFVEVASESVIEMDLCSDSTSDYRIEKERGVILLSEQFPLLPQRNVNCKRSFTFPDDSSLHVFILVALMPGQNE